VEVKSQGLAIYAGQSEIASPLHHKVIPHGFYYHSATSLWLQY